jgi:Cdc6-like AAA superfamily ATPase
MAKRETSLLGSITNLLLSFFKAIGWLLSSVYNLVANSFKNLVVRTKKPRLGATYIGLTSLRILAGSLKDFENRLLNSKSTVGLIIGARGSGKSALGLRILENVHAKAKRKVYAMGFKEENLPKWVKVVKKIDDVDEGSFILVDEGGIAFSSRDFMSSANKLLSNLLLIARHKDLSILFISQNSANLEVNAIRQADYLLLRKSSLLQKDFERKKIKEIYETAEKYLKESEADALKTTFVYSDEFQGLVENELPSFWTDEVSKAFKEFKIKQMD